MLAIRSVYFVFTTGRKISACFVGLIVIVHGWLVHGFARRFNDISCLVRGWYGLLDVMTLIIIDTNLLCYVWVAWEWRILDQLLLLFLRLLLLVVFVRSDSFQRWLK